MKEYNLKRKEVKMENTKDYITTYYSIGGWKPVLMSYDEDCKMHMPYQTGFGHKTKRGAEIEAQSWAEAEEIEYRK